MMIGFREFLDEGWKRRKGQTDHDEAWRHWANVGKHDVSMAFSGHKGRFGVDYEVDDGITAPTELNNRTKASSAAVNVLKHVHNRIDQFVRHRKPKELSFTGFHPTKHMLHYMLAKKLAKKHGGHISVNKFGNQHKVHFKHGEKSS